MNNKQPLTAAELGKVNSIGKVKFTRLFIKIYNRLCSGCKVKVMRNPKTDLTDFCLDCQCMIREKLRPFIKDETA